jgi:hypothetical protein
MRQTEVWYFGCSRQSSDQTLQRSHHLTSSLLIDPRTSESLAPLLNRSTDSLPSHHAAEAHQVFCLFLSIAMSYSLSLTSTIVDLNFLAGTLRANKMSLSR